MIKFLDTEGVNACLIRMIRKAEKELIIASPYLKTRKKLISYFNELIDRKVASTTNNSSRLNRKIGQSILALNLLIRA